MPSFISTQNFPKSQIREKKIISSEQKEQILKFQKKKKKSYDTSVYRREWDACQAWRSTSCGGEAPSSNQRKVFPPILLQTRNPFPSPNLSLSVRWRRCEKRRCFQSFLTHLFWTFKSFGFFVWPFYSYSYF